jgi:hypothetical protein
MRGLAAIYSFLALCCYWPRLGPALSAAGSKFLSRTRAVVNSTGEEKGMIVFAAHTGAGFIAQKNRDRHVKLLKTALKEGI